jgi:hypothetical protein
LDLRQKDPEKSLLGILDVCREFFIDPNTGLIINFDYFKNIEEYKKTTNYFEFKDSIEKIIYNNGTFEASPQSGPGSAKKLKNTGDILNPDGLIEDFEYSTYPEKFTLKNQDKAEPAKPAQEAESPSRLHLDDPGEARMTWSRSDHHDGKAAMIFERSIVLAEGKAKPGEDRIVHSALSTNAQIQTEYKIFYTDNNQQLIYIFSFVDKEIFFPLITLNYLLGEKKKEYVY